MILKFNDFVHKYFFKNKPTSYTNFYQILSSLGLNDVGIYLRDGPFSSDIGIVIFHPSKGTHWVLYIHENHFDSYGCTPTQKPSKINIKRNGHCLYFEYKDKV